MNTLKKSQSQPTQLNCCEIDALLHTYVSLFLKHSLMARMARKRNPKHTDTTIISISPGSKGVSEVLGQHTCSAPPNWS